MGMEINTNLPFTLQPLRMFVYDEEGALWFACGDSLGSPRSADRKPSRAFLDIYSFAAVDPTKPGIYQVHSSPATVSSLVLSSNSYRFQEIYTTQYVSSLQNPFCEDKAGVHSPFVVRETRPSLRLDARDSDSFNK